MPASEERIQLTKLTRYIADQKAGVPSTINGTYGSTREAQADIKDGRSELKRIQRGSMSRLSNAT